MVQPKGTSPAAVTTPPPSPRSSPRSPSPCSANDDRLQLRACLAPGCVLYFLKNHPRREWCTAACGNRARGARHYRRHRRPPT
ncbi:CGNR zinc finger domain-containing protein [Actinomadura rudentiformis]|nr:CGNR zinc finger domain-containing protein [Actinomadura rudentiformis]